MDASRHPRMYALVEHAFPRVAYRRSFGVTEVMFFQERLIAAGATDLGLDPAELRRRNLAIGIGCFGSDARRHARMRGGV